LKKLFIASVIAAIACCESAYAYEFKNPGKLVQLTSAAKSFSAARDLYNQCKLPGSIAAGNLPPNDGKAFLNIIENKCTCAANAIGEIWEEYGRNDLAAAMAMQRMDGKKMDATCNAKYLTPYIKE